MKKFFLVSNVEECKLYCRDYMNTHIPFVLNIHDMRYFDKLGLPFVSMHHFVDEVKTREFFKRFLRFVKSFADNMDQCNMHISEELLKMKLGLFSILNYNIFLSFYNPFRFAYCVHAMQEKGPCELVIPHDDSLSHSPKMYWLRPEDSFYFDDNIFKKVPEYLTDVANLSVSKITYVKSDFIAPQGRKNSFILKKMIKELITVYETCILSILKKDKLIITMNMPKAWMFAIFPLNTLFKKGGKKVVSLDTLIKYKNKCITASPDKRVKIAVSEKLSDNDFMPYFRGEEFIQTMLIPAFETMLNDSQSDIRILHQALSNTNLDAIIGTACGANFRDALASRLAKSKGLPIIGMQHGGHYGYMDFFEKMGYSDYDVCDYWLSWGFDGKYLLQNFEAGSSVTAEIVPTGSVAICTLKRKTTKSLRKKRYKILYPMVNNMRLVNATFRMDDFKLYKFQKAILERLLSSQVEVLLKPPCGFDSVWDDIFKKLPKNAHVSFAPLSMVYTKTLADWIILDFLSTPFEEACVTNSQIVVFNDSKLWPIETHARALMEKRAWLFDEENDFLDMLEKILEGHEFEARLDDAFEKEFILPHGTKSLNKVREELSHISSKHSYEKY